MGFKRGAKNDVCSRKETHSFIMTHVLQEQNCTTEIGDRISQMGLWSIYQRKRQANFRVTIRLRNTQSIIPQWWHNRK